MQPTPEPTHAHPRLPLSSLGPLPARAFPPKPGCHPPPSSLPNPTSGAWSPHPYPFQDSDSDTEEGAAGGEAESEYLSWEWGSGGAV